MPFDLVTDQGRPTGVPSVRARRAVSIWLFTICVMLLVMIGLGGATRLTNSGLSIMDWQPISGILPPLSVAEWERLFAIYKTIPQYKMQPAGFDLASFQHIFWLEWIHRFWGQADRHRLPAPADLLRRDRADPPQAAAGSDRHLLPRRRCRGSSAGSWSPRASSRIATHVQTVRLVAHLSVALLLYAAILWVAMTEWVPYPPAVPGALGLRRLVARSSC